MLNKKLVRICTLHSQLCPRDLTPGFLVDGFTPRCASTYSATAFYILIICIPYDFTIWTIDAPTWCCFPWVPLLVVTGLALILEQARVEAHLWVVAVHIVQPYSMVYYIARLLVADLTQSTIQGQPCVDVGLPRQLPCSASVELFLVHSIALISRLWPSRYMTGAHLDAGLKPAVSP